ncbi:unnamed protein product [Ceutorhynchus assimilis]|uniref:UDP-glucuronosyltransferase n=1 Tax=Ceutorhynchus assimilis TaxID=467358 RepID=A0A9N9QHM8_9CUCU|nr:unnamed protein product [Ceutorhynchus assimilis]
MATPVFCAILLFLSTATDGAKILGIFMTPSYSHQIVFQPIWKELSLRGHEVTVYTPSPLNDPSLTNLTEYDLSFSFEYMKQLEKAQYDFNKFFNIFEQISEAQLNHPYLKDLLKKANNQTFDLLLVEYLWSPYYAFKEIYNVPMVGITSLPLTIASSDHLGMERHPVVDPDLALQFSKAETFKQRVHAWIHSWLFRLVVNYKMVPKLKKQMKKHFGKVDKTTAELAKEVSLVLGNYNLALQNVRPITPNFIPISAIHVQPQKPLPTDLSKIMSNLKTDAIYFSLGSNVLSSQVRNDQLSKILKVLGKLPYAVLWKYEKDSLPDNLPKNFIVRKWFPQQDLLGHPKIKLFITQGGLQSLDEAIARKVPMLSIPFLLDQKTNSEKIVGLGIAETIDFNFFTEEELDEKVQKLLLDPSYQQNINKQSKIVSDQPMNSLDQAIFWIEYVLRHDGAHHLRYSAVDLPFYQYYLLDVYAFVLFLALFMIAIFRKIIFGTVLIGSSFVSKYRKTKVQ